MRANTLGSAFKRLSRDVHPPQRHAFLCVRAFTTARRMVYIRGARSDRRIGEEGCDPARASKNEGKSVFWKRSTVSATKRKRGERRSVPWRRHNSEITLEMSLHSNALWQKGGETIRSRVNGHVFAFRGRTSYTSFEECKVWTGNRLGITLAAISELFP